MCFLLGLTLVIDFVEERQFKAILLFIAGERRRIARELHSWHHAPDVQPAVQAGCRREATLREPDLRSADEIRSAVDTRRRNMKVVLQTRKRTSCVSESRLALPDGNVLRRILLMTSL